MQDNLNHIPNNELIQGCLSRSENYERFWLEFQLRFDDSIEYFIKKALLRYYCGIYPSQLVDKVSEHKQEVYLKLLNHNAKALRSFIGAYENSIFKYLEMICKSAVSNSFRFRKNRMRIVSIDELMETRGVASPVISETANYNLLKSDILFLIKQMYNEKKQRNLNRNMGIFRLYFFMGFTTKQISRFRFVKLSSSGVDTVVSRMRMALLNTFQDSLHQDTMISEK